MSVNRTEQSLERRHEDKHAAIERELAALKTRQLLGGDNIVYDWSGSASVTGTVPAYGEATFNVTLTSLVDVALFPLFLVNLYIGTTTADTTMRWPNGSALTTAVRTDTQLRWFYNRVLTSTDAEQWVVTVQIVNWTGGDHDYLMTCRFRYPRLQT